MRLNRTKLKETIRRVVQTQRCLANQGTPDPHLPVYATYLYCLVSQARKHLHMKWWNKEHPYVFDLKAGVPSYWSWPLGFKVVFQDIQDQEKFIEQARNYLIQKQEYLKRYQPTSPLLIFPVDFSMSDSEAISEDIQILTKRHAELVARGLKEKAAAVQVRLEELSLSERFLNS